MDPNDAPADAAIEGAIALLEALSDGGSPASLSGARLLARVPRIERLGRLVDAFRVSHAAEVSSRLGSDVDPIGAAGYSSAREAIGQLTGVSEVEARRRIRLGDDIAPGASLSGAPTAPRHPEIAAAVSAGNLGLEAADILVRGLGAVAHRVDPVLVHQAEVGLVELTAATPAHPPLRAELVREQLALYLLAIDPDGARPTEQNARIKRSLDFGRETADGMIPVKGLLVAEVGAEFKRLVDAHVRRISFVDQAEDAQVAADDRTPRQRRHDCLADIIGAAVRVADAPEIAGSAPAVIVTVTAETLASGRGVGILDDHDTPVSIDTVERLVDSRGLQLVTFDGPGRILSLGSVQRCFTSSQRRAIIARDGGCVIPGCTAPAGWCEVHHVIPWRKGGATHTDNGVLLCWGHHSRIDSGPWRLSMPDGVPHVRGPGLTGWVPARRSRVRTPLPRTG
jgi:hypothetical protein